MSVTEITTKNSPSGNLVCSRCNSPLPEHATFCSTCGERVDKNSKIIAVSSEFTDRYRITSLVRRSSCIQLFLAIDTIHQYPVVIRDIDISNVDNEIYTQAIDIIQGEYDLLRRQHIPDVMSVIDLHYSQDHLLLVQNWPFPVKNKNSTRDALTLHDLIQSGIGLPNEGKAITWTYRLCNALQRLHSQQITIGDLDPHLIAVSENNYSGQIALMVSWLPATLRKLLPEATSISSTTSFSAPETQEGLIGAGSDIYSLGAILYLLLTGTAPTRTFGETGKEIRPPRERNAKISSGVETVVMRALAHESAGRFVTMDEFAEVLLHLSAGTKPARPGHKTSGHKAIKQIAKQSVQEVEPTNNPDDKDKTFIIRPEETTQARRLREQLANHMLKPQKQQAGQPEIKQLPASITREERPIEEQSTVTIAKKEVLEGIAAARSKQRVIAAPLTAPMAGQVAVATKIRAAQEDHTDDEHPQKQSPTQGFFQRFATALPAISSLTALVSLPRRLPARFLNPGTVLKTLVPTAPPPSKERPLLQKLQHMLLGEQQHATTAVALIETPLGVQPRQNYHLRISVMGRNEPGLPPGAPPEMELSGLSALAHGDSVHIEVQTSLIQNYAYILQQADVEIPQHGYAAEVTIPLQALPDGPGRRRERLHISFMDETRQPLYEKPFVIEVFVSPHVQAGREGHNVLTIPF